LLPSSGSYTPTGFSPYQQLRASLFLQPSTRPVMRIEADAITSPYLAGNRLVTLDTELSWQASVQPQESLSLLDAESLPNGDFRFPLPNHHASTPNSSKQRLKISSLNNENFIFVNPDASFISGRFTAVTKSAADVWALAYDRGADRRWLLESGGSSTPDNFNTENLQLPEFWDSVLQTRSEEFFAGNRELTAANVLAHFQSRGYSLQTDFDPEQPFHDFFLNDRSAYCFWFATASTLALRANGIPSRLVGGYVAHEQLTSNLWLIRERDAHSWVEWQDETGYWHTMDPTPASIFGFFEGYRTSKMSIWYQSIAGQWQILIDRIIADDFTANLVRYGGLLILVFLFGREYRRQRQHHGKLGTRAQQWEKLWLRFLQITQLPTMTSWTATTYANNLPADWSERRKSAVRQFLQNYNNLRFASEDERALHEVETALDSISKSVAEG